MTWLGDERPVTGITLSVYSPRDSWYFRHPDAMLEASGFEVPLNPDNVFVRRGQALAALLDAAARRCVGGSLPEPHADNLAALFALFDADAEQLLRLALGERILADLRVRDLRELWAQATRNLLAVEVGARLPPGLRIHHRLCRPGSLRLATFGTLDRDGRWRPLWFWNPQTRELHEGDPDSPPAGCIGLSSKSSAWLLGFPLLQVSEGLARPHPVRGLEPLTTRIDSFSGGARDRVETGLGVARAFWGVEVSLVFDDRERTSTGWTVAWTDRREDQVLLRGSSCPTPPGRPSHGRLGSA